MCVIRERSVRTRMALPASQRPFLSYTGRGAFFLFGQEPKERMGGASAQVMSRRTARYSIPLTNRHNPDKKRPSCRSHAASTECFGETARWFYDASVVSLRENKAEPQRDAEAPDRPSAKSAGSPAALQFRNHNRAGAVAGDTICAHCPDQDDVIPE